MRVQIPPVQGSGLGKSVLSDRTYQSPSGHSHAMLNKDHSSGDTLQDVDGHSVTCLEQSLRCEPLISVVQSLSSPTTLDKTWRDYSK